MYEVWDGNRIVYISKSYSKCIDFRASVDKIMSYNIKFNYDMYVAMQKEIKENYLK